MIPPSDSSATVRPLVKGTVAWSHVSAALLFPFLLVIGPVVRASDHADPIVLRYNESGNTDLFAFPNPSCDRLVLIVCFGRGLANPDQLPLAPLRFVIHIDHHSPLTFADPGDLARYGGTVIAPEKIDADVTISYRLTDTIELAGDPEIEGAKSGANLPSPFVGLRDDPFIFHRFQTTNVVAIVQEIPFDCFTTEPNHFLIWATSERFGSQVDHVGRSLRTMLPRFEPLNSLHPREHVASLRRRHESPGVLQDIGTTFLSPWAGVRHYDFAPDVMIYSRQRPAGYPNGRLLTDDVAEICCRQGDCLLYEVSLAEADADHQPRPTTNRQGFLDEFPYLAEPNASPMPPEMPRLRWRTLIILAVAALIVLALLVGPWVLLFKCRRRLQLALRAAKARPS